MSANLREIDLKYNTNPVCPHCGAEDREPQELRLRSDGDCTEIECEACGEDFLVMLNIEYTYTTSKIGGDER